jgi:hypothetical protein
VPYKQPGIAPRRGKSGKVAGQLVKDPEVRAYQLAIIEWGILSGVAPLNPPYQIMFFWWRQLTRYQTDTGRNMTKRVADQTNLLKVTEDALQRRTVDPVWRGIIDNDCHDSFSGGLIVEQTPDTEPLIVIQIASEVPDQQRVYVPVDLMQETADGILEARARYEQRIALTDENRND